MNITISFLSASPLHLSPSAHSCKNVQLRNSRPQGCREYSRSKTNKRASPIMNVDSNHDDEPFSLPSPSRRQFIKLLAATGASFIPLSTPERSDAVNGLRILPLREPLTNSYYLMRACETSCDASDTVCTNPIDKLSIEKLGLTKRGVTQAMSAADTLVSREVDFNQDSVWIWPSVAVSSYETAEVLASELRVRRDHIVPEFSFLDARGLGIDDGKRMSSVMKYVHANDQLNTNWRPAPGEDGTPNDSVQDVFVRVRQLVSKLETQYFAEDIIIIAPDSEPLSIWQAAVMGIDMGKHSTMKYEPGEIRLVKEKVVDAYGKETGTPFATTIFKPSSNSTGGKKQNK